MSTSDILFTQGVGTSIATHLVTEDGKQKQIERIAPGAGVINSTLSFSSVSAAGLVPATTDTQGKGRIVVSAKSVTGNTDAFTFRLVYKSAAEEIIGTSPIVQGFFTELTSGGSPDYRYSTVSVFANDACAAYVQVYVVTMPSSGSLQVAVSSV